jgi:RNA ligase (TIGR02306 family)
MNFRMKIASIERITAVQPHPNADRLDLISVLGYQCVAARASFSPNELIVFIQPDSVLPNDQAWAETYLKYARPRVCAMKIRNQWSQGLIVPLTANERELKEGDDVADRLHITHYQANVTQDPSSIIGPLPLNIPKTDEERVENLTADQLPWNTLVDVTQKIDGTSCSIYYDRSTKRLGVCGRNHEYDRNKSNQFSYIVNKYDLDTILPRFCEENQCSVVLRGEMFGGGIQKKSHNPHAAQALQWAMFSVYLLANDGNQGRYARRNTDGVLYSIRLAEHLHLPHVPIVERQVPLTKELIDRFAYKVNLSFGEGVVIQHDHGSLKIINKNYDVKN